MANLGVVGVRSTAIITGNALNAQASAVGKLPAPDPYPLTYATFPDQSEPTVHNFPGNRLFLGL